jgi:hypothetical protein
MPEPAKGAPEQLQTWAERKVVGHSPSRGGMKRRNGITAVPDGNDARQPSQHQLVPSARLAVEDAA